MGHRMSVYQALIHLILFLSPAYAFVAGVDGPLLYQEALEGGNTTLYCDTNPATADDELMLLVWYKNDDTIYSYDARIGREWSSVTYNISSRMSIDLQKHPTALSVSALREDDQALYHCRVEFLFAPTRYIGVHLGIIVLPSKPFFLDELGNKLETKVGPYFEGDTLMLICLVIGGRPPPQVSWYSGEVLVDASGSESEIPNVRQNELYLPLTRDNTKNLSCKASNTQLSPPISSFIDIELYLPAENVSIHWIEGVQENSLQVGKTAMVKCIANGVYPSPDIAWWLNHKHLTQYSNQTWNKVTMTSVSFLQLVPTIEDNQATLACVATNPAIPPGRNSKADVVTLNVTYIPIVEISTLKVGKLNGIIENNPLNLTCEVNANPPANKFKWFFNDTQIKKGDIWGDEVLSSSLLVQEVKRTHTGQYSCVASNKIGETESEEIDITVFYAPECNGNGLTLKEETIICNITALPVPKTYYWHIQIDSQIQNFTTDLPFIPLTQLIIPLTKTIEVVCKAENGISSQQKPCMQSFSLKHLRPQPPKQCDLAYEGYQFQIRCIPVDNATHYEVTVWRQSNSNASLILDQRTAVEFGVSQALIRNHEEMGIVKGELGVLDKGDETGAAACNRYGCSKPLLLRPTDNLLNVAGVPWWNFLLERDVGVAIGVTLLLIIFVISTAIIICVLRKSRRKPPAPVIQVLQIDDVTREFLNSTRELKAYTSRSLQSCSSDYLHRTEDHALMNWSHEHMLRDSEPPPDVTLTMHRESAV